MEANKNNQKEDSKSSSQSNPLGFDINSLLSNTNVMEILKHLLSGAGAMAGNYFIWIKPMQDKMEAMNKTIAEQEKRIRELETEQIGMLDEDDDEEVERNQHRNIKSKSNDYFKIGKQDKKPIIQNRYRHIQL